MQTIDSAINELAATAKSPDSTSPQKSNASQPGIDEDLLKIIDEIVAEIRTCAANGLGWRLKMCVNLREYRDSLDGNDWNQVLNSGRLPFSARTAQMLVRIGDHKILADMKRTHQLPESMTVLNELAGLPLPTVEQALANGTIHPGTALKEAKKLLAEHRAKKAVKPIQRPTIIPL